MDAYYGRIRPTRESIARWIYAYHVHLYLLDETFARAFVGDEAVEELAEPAARAFAPSAHVHVFGHSHLNVDTTVDGVRYVQCALGYPSERWFGINYPKLVHTTH